MFAFDGKLELPKLRSQAGAWERAVLRLELTFSCFPRSQAPAWERAVLELDPAEPYFFIAFAKALAIKLLIGAGAAACFCL